MAHLDSLVTAERLLYPKQVLKELGDYAGDLKTDPAYGWAKRHEAKARYADLLLDEARAVLALHPNLIDPDEVATGRDPADPYVVALAQLLRSRGVDARIVTDDYRQKKDKVSLAAVAGVLGVPSTVMKIFLKGEGFEY